LARGRILFQSLREKVVKVETPWRIVLFQWPRQEMFKPEFYIRCVFVKIVAPLVLGVTAFDIKGRGRTSIRATPASSKVRRVFCPFSIVDVGRCTDEALEPG
jgi:hypothetical protein